MRLSKDLIGKAVVTIDDGTIVGHVKDIYLADDLSALAGIHLGKEGIIRRKSILIPADGVVVFGIDVILVKDADVVTDDREFKGSDKWVRLDSLQGREVDTPGGTKVGVVGDVVLDEEGGVTAYSLSRVYVEGPIEEKRFVFRHAIIDNGSEDGIMTIDLIKAEKMEPAPEPEETPLVASDEADEEELPEELQEEKEPE